MTEGEEVIPLPAAEVVPAGLRDMVGEFPGQPCQVAGRPIHETQIACPA